jgi:hypothetical protein
VERRGWLGDAWRFGFGQPLIYSALPLAF